jgi:hypothetical protein
VSSGVRAFSVVNWNRLLSGLVAAGYIVAAFIGGGAEAGFVATLFVILPLACIWFSHTMGGYVGPVWRGVITNPSPGLAVCIAGWLLLLLPGVVEIIHACTLSKP